MILVSIMLALVVQFCSLHIAPSCINEKFVCTTTGGGVMMSRGVITPQRLLGCNYLLLHHVIFIFQNTVENKVY